MTVLPQHIQRAIRNKIKAAAHLIAAEYNCEASDVFDIAVTDGFGTTQAASISGAPTPFMRLKSTTPSRPEVPTHAPAAQTDGEVAVLPASPSVDLSGLAAHEQGPIPSPSPMANAPEPESRSTVSRQPGSGDFLPKAKRQEARERVQAVFDAHPDWAPSLIAVAAEVHISTAREWIRQMKAKAGETAPPDDREAKLRAMFENGQPTATEAALALGYIGQGGVRKLAKRLGLEFRPVSKAEVADLIRDGMRHTAARTAKAQTTEALRRATEKPQEAERPSEAPKVKPEPEQPPAVKYAAPRPQDDASDVLHRVQKAPQGRFYLRERTDVTAQARYVHQSLAPCPTGPGPLMTSDRKWAWYDTMDRFNGAVKKWPELRDMRKEAVTNA